MVSNGYYTLTSRKSIEECSFSPRFQSLGSLSIGSHLPARKGETGEKLTKESFEGGRFHIGRVFELYCPMRWYQEGPQAPVPPNSMSLAGEPI